MGIDRTRLLQKPRHRLKTSHLGLAPPRHVEPSAWFLGPKGENLTLLQELMDDTFVAHAGAREAFSDREPDFIDDATRADEPFRHTAEDLKANLAQINRALRSSTPMSAYRNKSHMNWDVSLPGVLGYVAGMLFNANNVAPEASPVTTQLELKVGQELCEMLGFDISEGAAVTPWGHITCDGSVANYESMWAARNLRFQGAALARAIRLEDDLAPARGLMVSTARGNLVRLLDLEPWDLVNLPNAQILDLPRRLHEEAGIPEERVGQVVKAYSLQNMGLLRFYSEILPGISPPVVLCPATAHYSWDKGAALLGLGLSALRHVAVDVDARMAIPALRAQLDAAIDAQSPVLQVVAVCGTTGESAVDPIAEIEALRVEYAAKGLSFALHVDAAWGGYFASMLRPPKGQDGFTPSDPLSPHVTRHLHAVAQADSITIDPHKSGYMPYPAGALCYRDVRMTRLIAFAAPVVFHSEAPSVGVYGIEGSKPGAAASGVALSHTTIPLDQAGYGELLGRCVFNAKRWYMGLLSMARDSDPFWVTCLPRTPGERAGSSEQIREEHQIFRELHPLPNAAFLEALKMKRVGDLVKDVGPDMTVLAYALNFSHPDGTPNTDMAAANEFNNRVFEACSVEVVAVKDQVPKVDLLVTSSVLDPQYYGEDFMDLFCERLGVEGGSTAPRVLISTMMDPWVSDASGHNLIPMLTDTFRDKILEVWRDMTGG
ncbi:MAG: pyridoxal-dependent decarboxylase [Pseudomonadota bacterium]